MVVTDRVELFDHEAPVVVHDEIPPPPRPWIRWADRAAVALAILAGVVLRFIADTPLWLDEALSVNIAELPLGDIPDALRRDGHPPLYYFLLHGWMDVVGSGDAAVRALSAVFGLALLPLGYLAGKRLAGHRGAWFALLVFALSPFAIRFSTEARMYSLVMLLSLGAWLLADDALDRPTWARLSALAVATALLLYAHYWAMWLLAAATVGLVWIIRQTGRAGRSTERRNAIRVLGALVGGGVLFLPWVPVLAYQSAHTGTPWAARVLPSGIVSNTLGDFGGGPNAESVAFGWACAGLVLIGVFAQARTRRFLEVDLHSQPEARPLLYVFGATVVLAALVSYATGSTFVSRYVAVVFPLFVLLVALGLTRFASPVVLRIALGAVLVLGVAGGVRNAVDQRTQAAENADGIIERINPGEVVAYCPDQLAVSSYRALEAQGAPPLEQVTYPEFGDPEFVDWVDYTERLDRADPTRFAEELSVRVGNRQVVLVYDTSYITHEETCDEVKNALARLRPSEQIVNPNEGNRYAEPATVIIYGPPY